MRILSTQVNKSLFVASFIFFVCVSAEAQRLGDLLFGADSKVNYMGQYNYNGKRKNGFGIERQRGDVIYVGDFVEDNISGRGMLISQQKGISNVPGATVYVGNWMNGKKQGKGVCYNVEGNIVFSGKFDGDKPVSGSEIDKQGQHFAIINDGEMCYLGETVNNSPNGLGLTVVNDGSVIFGTVREGHYEGIGMMFYSPELWEVGRWTDGQFKAFDNSQIAASKLAAFKQENKAINSQMFGYFAQAAQSITQLTTDIVTASNGGVSDSDSGYGDAGNIPSGKSQSFYQAEYDKWAFKAKNQFGSKVRHKVNTKTTMDGQLTVSDGKLLRTYQKAMRDIRNAARKEGYTLKVSEYENANF